MQAIVEVHNCDQSLMQPTLEVIDDLCFTIQRQSASCLELVRQAVAIEREQCARAAELIADSLAAADETAKLAASEIAERIRARSSEIAWIAGAAV